MKGKLISFEGIDGSGKSTQARMLFDHLSGKSITVHILREPGGTEIGERIRDILLDRAHHDMTPISELFLYLAARAQITSSLISPYLLRGDTVIMDRYIDSTTVYQGYVRGIGVDIVSQLNRIATDGLLPDLTIVVDCDTSTALSRLTGAPDRLESEGISFMERVREGFLLLCNSESERVMRVDGCQDVNLVFSDVLNKTNVFFQDFS